MKKINADKYNIEDLLLKDMEMVEVRGVTNFRDGIGYKFKVEDEMKLSEKIDFIDKMEDGFASYMLKLIEKWEDEKDSLPKDAHGKVKTISQKAWLKRNDEKEIVRYRTHDYPRFYFNYQGNEYPKLNLVCPKTKYRHSLMYSGEHVVNQWFHDLLKKLEKREIKYFKENNPFEIKLSKVRKLGKRHGITFNDEDLWDICMNHKRNVTDEALDAYINAYEKLDEAIDEISESLKKKLEGGVR